MLKFFLRVLAKSILSSFFIFSCVAEVNAEMKPIEIDTLAEKVMNTFSIPGVAIGIIEKGNITHVKGYGVKNIHNNQPINTNTIFKIASNSKAFTTAALAILVDEKKISWQGKVVDYLPNFKMHDEWVTKEFTVKDLLTHRSGLGLGAGDLMLWPEPSSFSRAEILHNLRYLKPSGEFRASYAYDNLLYIVAGEIIPAVTGMSWQQFIHKRIIKPLGMTHCYAGDVATVHHQDLAQPHGIVAGKLEIIQRKKNPNKELVSAAAGGIQCSITDMLKWANVFLNQGKYGDGQQLFSVAQYEEMWSAQTIMPISNRAKRWDNSHFSSYGLGWRMNDVNGYLRVHHSGSLSGMYSYVSFFPELELGIVILTNQQSSRARNALMYSLMKSYLPLSLGEKDSGQRIDWLQEMLKGYEQPVSVTNNNMDKNARENEPLSLVMSEQESQRLIGTYRDAWLGDFIIEKQKDKLKISSKRMETLVGELIKFGKNKYAVTWDDRGLEADVYAIFSLNDLDEIMTMKLLPQSKSIDFSYDFQDLLFRKIK